MGIRFRKSIKIAPGVKVNLGKKSAGISIGGKAGGVSINSKRGVTARASVPGTGVSYSTRVGGGNSKKQSSTNTSSNSSFPFWLKACGIIALYVLIVFVFMFVSAFFASLFSTTPELSDGMMNFMLIAPAIVTAILVILLKRKKTLSSIKQNTTKNAEIKMYGVDGQTGEVFFYEDNPNDLVDDIKSMEYYQTINKELKPIEDEMVHYAVELKSKVDVDTELYLLNCIIDNFYKLKEISTRLGPDYEKYFSKKWEHGHNSRNPDFCYVDRFVERKQYLLDNHAELKKQEKQYEEASFNLEQRVKVMVQRHSPIKQTEVYKLFDPSVKKDIQSILYFMEKDGIITRRKIGNTYEITFNSK